MTACRLCRSVYPKDQFITGNGPRYQVCVRCAVENDFVSADEAPQLYDDATAKARLRLMARRYSGIGTLLAGWSFWALMFQGLELWTPLMGAVLGIATIAIPLQFFLGSARFQADLRRLTP